ncbi:MULTISPECIES: hypothetical protein [unclassified Microbacterium]|uniref:hypothetical protein n=1 Tax=unclassified Microbacterium TaxID=2609290 RepID=UPI003465E095
MSHLVRSGAWVAGALVAGVSLAACAADSAPRPIDESSPAPDASEVDYRDGEYAAIGWYGSLPSHQDVALTIEDDIVTEVTITTPAEDPTSLQHQQAFADALPGEIVGQQIDVIALDRLAGASGCSEGFMNALAEIKTRARA